MPEPYYRDEQVTLYHGNCCDVLPTLGTESVDCVITDPPYSEHAHTKARKKIGRSRAGADLVVAGVTEFSAITADDLSAVLSEAGRVSRGWVIATIDYRHAFGFDAEPPLGLKMQRLGVWVKTNPTPQITGDRPALGWEVIAYMHRDDRRSNWNGGGLHGNYTIGIDQSAGHPTAKPLPLVGDLVRKFSSIGDTICDPFAGSGTTLRAAVNEGRCAIGIEIDEHYCELIAKRMGQLAMDFEATS